MKIALATGEAPAKGWASSAAIGRHPQLPKNALDCAVTAALGRE